MNSTQTIELYQPVLRSIAFKILQCKADAEDIVQDTFLKWLSVDQEKVKNTKAYLVKAVTNNCLNHLNTLRKKKEQCTESLSELLEKFRETDFSHLDIEAKLSEAFHLLQRKLEPLERAVYLLREIFDFEYETLQEVLNKKQEHCRQVLCRARKKLSEETQKINLELPQFSALKESFRKACDFGNVAELVENLQKDISPAPGRKF